jgi:hypothetical protein
MGIVEAIGGVAMLAAGWFQKKKTNIPHKMTGAPTNLVLGQVVALVSPRLGGPEMSPQDGLALFATVEAIVHSSKAFLRIWKGLKKNVKTT